MANQYSELPKSHSNVYTLARYSEVRTLLGYSTANYYLSECSAVSQAHYEPLKLIDGTRSYRCYLTDFN